MLHSKTVKNANHINLVKVTSKSSKKAQKLLNIFKANAIDAPEEMRNKLASKLCAKWKQSNIPFPPPAVYERNDYWYLSQLFSLNRHIHQDSKPYKLQLDRTEEVLIADIFNNNKSLVDSLFQFLMQNAIKTGLMTSHEYKRILTAGISRNHLDRLLDQNHEDIMIKLGLDTVKYKIIPLPYDILLRFPDYKNFKPFINIFFDGYRLRIDGLKTALFGGDDFFGGVRFIDSIWQDTSYSSIIPMLVVMRKDYGY